MSNFSVGAFVRMEMTPSLMAEPAFMTLMVPVPLPSAKHPYLRESVAVPSPLSAKRPPSAALSTLMLSDEDTVRPPA